MASKDIVSLSAVEIGAVSSSATVVFGPQSFKSGANNERRSFFATAWRSFRRIGRHGAAILGVRAFASPLFDWHDIGRSKPTIAFTVPGEITLNNERRSFFAAPGYSFVQILRRFIFLDSGEPRPHSRRTSPLRWNVDLACGEVGLAQRSSESTLKTSDAQHPFAAHSSLPPNLVPHHVVFADRDSIDAAIAAKAVPHPPALKRRDIGVIVDVKRNPPKHHDLLQDVLLSGVAVYFVGD